MNGAGYAFAIVAGVLLLIACMAPALAFFIVFAKIAWWLPAAWLGTVATVDWVLNSRGWPTL